MAPNFNSNFLLKNESHQPMEQACLNSIIKQYFYSISSNFGEIRLIYTIPALGVNIIYATMNLFLLKRIIFKKASNIQLHRDRKNLVILSKFLNFSILSNLAAISWILNVVQKHIINAKIILFIFICCEEQMCRSDELGNTSIELTLVLFKKIEGYRFNLFYPFEPHKINRGAKRGILKFRIKKTRSNISLQNAN
ncbi:hypothetical protein BpHYR1_019157 [Brachionus plicatilis]|uniref:Uncharacterized protein n=1 Tax=Brachionus plicatilis TaxID=10195 RepID=A0A3M7PP32_BRAPC|nr:hypothetical protein BpHYR1_019157 [Brachionus plicatilis]